MNTDRMLQSVIALLALLAVSGCGQPAAPQKPAAPKTGVEVGKVENNVYTNSYFGITLQIPQGWFVPPNDTMERVTKIGMAGVAGDNKAMQAALDAAPSVSLVAAFEKAPGPAAEFPPSCIAVAEKVSMMPGILKGADYLEHAKTLLSQGRLKYKFGDTIRTVQLGGRDFDLLEAELQMKPDVVMKTQYYATIEKGYAVALILSYRDDADKAKLDPILKSLSFPKPAEIPPPAAPTPATPPVTPPLTPPQKQ